MEADAIALVITSWRRGPRHHFGTRVEWHFFPNAAGEVGPSGPLLNALQKAGFTVIIH